MRASEAAKWLLAGLLFRVLAPPILMLLFSVVVPHLTTIVSLTLVAAKLIGSGPQTRRWGATGGEALPAPTAAAHIMLKPSDATPETAAAPSPRLTESPVLKPRSSVRSSKSLVRSSLTKPPNSIQLRTALRASHAKRSEVQDILERMCMKQIALMGGSISGEIRRCQLEEADYRGDRYPDHPYELMGNDDVLVVTFPDVVEQIYCAFLDAGVDILATNTYNSTWVNQIEFGLQDDAEIALLNVEAARLAKRCANAYMEQNPDSFKLVAGAIGPPKRASAMPTLGAAEGSFTYSELVDAYFKQVSALYSGGVDLFLLELACDSTEAKAALSALEQFVSKMEAPLPVIICGTVAAAGGSLAPLPDAFLSSVRRISPFAVGLRSATASSADLLPLVKDLATACPDCYLCCFPSASTPAMPGTEEEEMEEEEEEEEELGSRVAEDMRTYCVQGCANLLGDCCSLAPRHVAVMQSMAAAYRPRQVSPEDNPSMWLEPPMDIPAASTHPSSHSASVRQSMDKPSGPGVSVRESIEKLRQHGLAI